MQTAKGTAPVHSRSDALRILELFDFLEQKDQLIADCDQVITDNERTITDQKCFIEERQKLLKLREEKLRMARQKHFGVSSEKLHCQGDLFYKAELEAALSEEEKTRASQTFFTKVKEEFDTIPAQARVLEYWQKKVVFKQADGSQRIEVATRPAHLLGKCLAGNSLQVYLLVAKFADALLLYRLEKIFKGYGVTISRTAMANWIIGLDSVFTPLIKLIREQQLSGDYLQADDTRQQVLKESGKVATSGKWMWLIRGGPSDKPAVLFDNGVLLSEEVPLRLLEGFEGMLWVDDYSGYNWVCLNPNITRIRCCDHARCKFVDASKAVPDQKKGAKVSKADVVLVKIRKLYAIEDRIKPLNHDDKHLQCQRLSKRQLEGLKDWLKNNVRHVPKDSLTYKAHYKLHQWNYPVDYCKDGQLDISDALAENTIRPFAVGRRNCLFTDTPRGTSASAADCSVIETAKANGLKPYDYLLYVLKHIALADTIEKLVALLHWNIKPEGL